MHESASTGAYNLSEISMYNPYEVNLNVAAKLLSVTILHR